MADSPVVDRNYTYSRGGRIWPPEAVDVHDVALRKRRTATRLLVACLFAAALAFRHLFVSQDSTLGGVLWRLIYSAVFFKVMLRRAVVKVLNIDSESVVVMPTFGIQLETHYSSGQVIRRFVPVGKILKLVLVECVTPVTCYWSLSLILQDESDVMLVFKMDMTCGFQELRPPLKMLVPIWKALCLASGDPESSVASVDVVRRRERSSKVV